LPFFKLKGEMRTMDIKIGEKTYKIEFTFEAALYDDCVTSLFDLVANSADGSMQGDAGKVLVSMAGKPSTVATLFYAGLLEHNPVDSMSTAKELLKQYFNENKGKKDANFYGVFAALNKQMETDGFLDLIGLTAVLETLTENAKKLTAPKLQGHKKKAPSTLQN